LANQNNKIRQDTSIKNNNQKEFQSQINHPNLVGMNMENGVYYIKAQEMQEVTDLYNFTNPIVELMLEHQDWLNITSKTAQLEKKSNILHLFDDVEANFNKEYFFSGKQAEIDKSQAIIKSDQYSRIFNDRNSLESETGFILNRNDETIFFFGKINADLKQKNGNTNIKSEKFDVFWKKKLGNFIGNVILTKNDTSVHADKMIAFLNYKTNELEKIHAFGNVKITDKENIATGSFGEYVVATEILTLKENVTLQKGENIAKGDLLHYNFTTQKANLVSSSKTNHGRVKAIIIPKETK